MEKKSHKKILGKVTHYYDKAGVAIVKLSAPVAVGDEVHFCGNKTDFEQTIESMQVEHGDIKNAKKGDEVGVKVNDKVREGDEVYAK